MKFLHHFQKAFLISLTSIFPNRIFSVLTGSTMVSSPKLSSPKTWSVQLKQAPEHLNLA